MQSDLVTTAEAAAILGCSVATVNRWAAEGRLTAAVQFPGVRGARLYVRADVEAEAADESEASA